MVMQSQAFFFFFIIPDCATCMSCELQVWYQTRDMITSHGYVGLRIVILNVHKGFLYLC